MIRVWNEGHWWYWTLSDTQLISYGSTYTRGGAVREARRYLRRKVARQQLPAPTVYTYPDTPTGSH